MNRYATAARAALIVITLFACQLRTGAAEAAHIYGRTLRGTGLIVTPSGTGSGWMLDAKRGLLVTSEHVVTGHDRVEVIFPEYDKAGRPQAEMSYYRQHGRRLKAEVVDADRR